MGCPHPSEDGWMQHARVDLRQKPAPSAQRAEQPYRPRQRCAHQKKRGIKKLTAFAPGQEQPKTMGWFRARWKPGGISMPHASAKDVMVSRATIAVSSTTDLSERKRRRSWASSVPASPVEIGSRLVGQAPSGRSCRAVSQP